jgi:tetratricopeptide (TPR) repeat protein
MQDAPSATVLGDFGGARFVYAGVTSTFFRSGDRCMVRTDGPTGALEELPVRFTFGVSPLQRYLIEPTPGRLQTLGIAWDTRPRAQGGQRWFHLYPSQRITPSDALHWTQPLQSWNAMCADCHSTDLRRGYDPSSGRYATTYAEIDVSCEAWHGPGATHVAWAQGAGDAGRAGHESGLAPSFDERRGVLWDIDARTGNARPSRPRDSTREIEACARCHARRGELGIATIRTASRCAPRGASSASSATRRIVTGHPRTITTPNACNGCHTDRDARWAAAQVRRWYGEPEPGFQRFAEALHAGSEGAPGTRGQLLRLAADLTQPGIARASALARLDAIPDATAVGVVRRLLDDDDALVRRAAVEAYALAPLAAPSDLLPRRDDPVRDVSLSAARRVATLPLRALPDGAHDQPARAAEAYIAAQRALGDRPEAQSNLGALYLELGRTGEAEAAFSRALALDRTFVPAAVNLAELLRRTGRDPEGEPVLRRTLATDSAIVHHALGLWLIRAGRRDEALTELGKAAERAPDEPHQGYVLAVALEDAGRTAESRRVLAGVMARHPYHRESLRALASLERAAGRVDQARSLAARLAELERE